MKRKSSFAFKLESSDKIMYYIRNDYSLKFESSFLHQLPNLESINSKHADQMFFLARVSLTKAFPHQAFFTNNIKRRNHLIVSNFLFFYIKKKKHAHC